MSQPKSHMLLTVREVSLLLRIQRPKVYELIHQGAIDGFKVGADWRIRRDSVEALVGPISEDFFKKMKPEKPSQEVPTQSGFQPSVLRG